MTQNAKVARVSPQELVELPVGIISRISVENESAELLPEIMAALETAFADADIAGYSVTENAILVATRWEPPFKGLRAVSAKFPAVRLVMKSDAFRSEYWISRAAFEGGKQTVEDVLTMNDGEAFHVLFKEIHGQSYTDWKAKNQHGAVRGGFAWGAVDGFDASKSELGKAEGQA